MADLPVADLRRTPADFLVEELPLYPPSGRGEHLYVTFRKTGRTTLDVVRALSAALGTDPRGAGWAGMKDRHAVTTQTVSFPVPMARDAEQAMAAVAIPGVEVLGAARHDNKLKPGHLAGNRFRIVLRGLPPAEVEPVAERLRALGRTGVPNAFGPQRFGRDGDNPARAVAWLAGKERGPRDRREQRLLFSALQSLLFNRVLARREADGTWNRVLPGDLAKKSNSGGLFLVPAAGAEADDAAARGERGLLWPTGPMFGAKMRWPEGAPAALEREVLAESLGESPPFDAHRNLGEGTRRPLVLPVTELEVERLADDAGNSEAAVAVRFVLPKGGYATTVLGRACVLKDRQGAADEAAPDDEGA